MQCCLEPGCPVVVPKGRCAKHARAKEQERPNLEARKWYHIIRWCHPTYGLRAQVLSEEPLCRECLKEEKTEPSAEVDHIVPHRGDYDLFFDRENLQGLCKTHHSRKTQRGE